MSFSSVLLDVCILTIACWASLTVGNPIVLAASLGEANSVDSNLPVRVDSEGGLSGAVEEQAEAASGMDITVDFGQGAAPLPGQKRSVAANDNNLSLSPAAFAVAEDLSGVELAQIMQGMISSHDALSSSTVLSISCTGEVVNHTASSSNYSTYTHTDCPADLAAVTSNGEPNDRSLCPWTYVENVDENRYPRSIMYAQCACPLCIREDGQGFSEDQECQPIYYKVKVLRKHSCQGGIQIYESDYEQVPVACACLRYRTA